MSSPCLISVDKRIVCCSGLSLHEDPGVKGCNNHPVNSGGSTAAKLGAPVVRLIAQYRSDRIGTAWLCLATTYRFISDRSTRNAQYYLDALT